jgi:small subunit ribosomal protein S3
MGHKVHPKIHRTPFIFPWDSRWFAKKEALPQFLEQEIAIREFLHKKLKEAGIDSISIERSPKDVTVTILAAKPGVVIGRGGAGLEELRKHVEKNILQFKKKVKINIMPLNQPALSAAVVAQNAALDTEKRIPFRRVMEIARREKLSAGKMSLITLRSNVDYGFAEAHTMYGKIGIKVWIYNGESFGRRDKFEKKADDAVKKPARTHAK